MRHVAANAPILSLAGVVQVQDGLNVSLVGPFTTLFQPYPNPFNSGTTVSVTLPERSDLRVAIFDIMGRQVATLASGTVSAGVHHMQWDASKVASGVYFVHVHVLDKWSASKKLILLK